MKNSEIVQMTAPELVHLLETLEKERLNLRIQAKTGQLKNSARMTVIRKDAARIKTELRKRDNAEPAGSSKA
ncbi:MAG TPA: 50S ribosomal protein L29 [Victivallales bacterium]|nr:50S ribosomal protein L29 [Victivallales bacterium]